MRHVILGTAGHIDHGKTTLVKALTGTDTDRLPEEKARGITIDLGFAHLQLGDLNVGIVDVPGHEGLIRNMLAGATGFDAMMLVVAADEGVMPQTREHLAIAQLLGVERMIVALTKCDLVDADWLELVTSDVQQLMKSAGLSARTVAVSALSAMGLSTLRDALRDELSQAAQRRDDDVFCMPIDRVFSVRGTGTVVTGTVWSGRLGQHDNARILPGDHDVRIRAVQSHGASVEQASAGERSAFALVGVDREEVGRGQCLVNGRGWTAVPVLTCRVRMLGGAQLKQRQRVRLHVGTAETMARVHLLEADWVQLRLETPAVARVGDRFVLRTYSPVATIGGGVVAEVGWKRQRVTAADLDHLRTLIDGEPADRIAAVIALRGEAGCGVDELPIVSGVAAGVVEAFAGAPTGDVAKIGERFFATPILTDAVHRLVRRVKRFHDAHPLERGIERAELLAELPPALSAHALARAEAENKLTAHGSLVWLSGFEPGFSPKQQILRDQILAQLRQAGLAAPTVPELTSSLRSNEVRAVLRLLEAEGTVTAVNFDLYLDAAVLADAIGVVRAELRGGGRAAADFKAVLPVSRKYLIPLLEYMDRSGVTRREGDLRWIENAELPETA